jgi:hypothetical protein
MTRVFEKGSDDKIKHEFHQIIPQIASSENEEDFKILHDSFCQWFGENIKTAERKKDGIVIKESSSASYGQGAKVLNVALKVYVYYCYLPDHEAAIRTTKWLQAAIDTKMLKYLKENWGYFSASSIEDVDKETYFALQKLVMKDIIKNKDKFPRGTCPVEWEDIMWRELNKEE